MRRVAIPLILALATALPATAGPTRPSRNEVTSICLDPSGRTLPVTCRTKASRVEYEEYICQCLNAGEQVKIAICPEGVRPPTESAAYERARRAAVQRGSLLGPTFEGRPMCVDRTNVLTGR